jgi:hypothetical protein
MPIWRFLVYSALGDPHSFWLWRAGLPPEVRGKVDRYLRSFQNTQILSKPFKSLSGGLWEFKLEIDNVQQRPIGYVGPGQPGQKEFTFLLAATKKTGRKRNVTRWDPPEAPALARDRIKIIEKDRRYVEDYRFDPPATN